MKARICLRQIKFTLSQFTLSLFKNMTYQAAYEQLTALIDAIESGDVPLDALPEKIRQATELIAFCQDRLRAVEGEYQQAAESLQKRN